MEPKGRLETGKKFRARLPPAGCILRRHSVPADLAKRIAPAQPEIAFCRCAGTFGRAQARHVPQTERGAESWNCCIGRRGRAENEIRRKSMLVFINETSAKIKFGQSSNTQGTVTLLETTGLYIMSAGARYMLAGYLNFFVLSRFLSKADAQALVLGLARAPIKLALREQSSLA